MKNLTSKNKILASISLIFLWAFSTHTNAELITISPEEIINVSSDGDENYVGDLVTHSLSGSTIIARERRVNDGNQDCSPNGAPCRIASYLFFDVSSLSSWQVSSTEFSAVFNIDFTERLNTQNAMSVLLGAAVNSWTSTPGMLPLFSDAASSTNQSVLVNNVRTDAFGQYSIDLTELVRGWVLGDLSNNGVVIFGNEREWQGAGFENAALDVKVPEPGALGLFGLALLAMRRFKRS